MPIKRRASKAKSPARFRAGKVTTVSRSQPTSRFLSAEEKRELILAHAATRRPLDPVQRLSMWAGVAICAAVVIVGWMYTVGSGIKDTLASPLDAHFEDVSANMRTLQDQVNLNGSNSLSAQLENISGHLDALSSQQAVVNGLASAIRNATSSPSTTSTSRADLFVPSPTSPTSITSSSSTP